MSINTMGERLSAAPLDKDVSNAEPGRKSAVSKQNIGMIRNDVSCGHLATEPLFAPGDALGVNARWLALAGSVKEKGRTVATLFFLFAGGFATSQYRTHAEFCSLKPCKGQGGLGRMQGLSGPRRHYCAVSLL